MTVVVPLSTKPLMISKIRAAGAHKVIQFGETWNEADTHLREVILKEDQSGIYVPPFDHPDIWSGHSTLMHELADQMNGERPDAIICSVGGGGLFNGIMQGLDELGWTDTTVIAVETVGAESLNKSIAAGRLVTLPRITSIATSLGAVRVTPKSFEYGKREQVRSIAVPDQEAAMGCWRLADDERIMVEPACGVSVSLCYDGKLERALGKAITMDTKVVVILCGGSGVTVEMLSSWKETYGSIDRNLPQLKDVPSSQAAHGETI